MSSTLHAVPADPPGIEIDILKPLLRALWGENGTIRNIRVGRNGISELRALRVGRTSDVVNTVDALIRFIEKHGAVKLEERF